MASTTAYAALSQDARNAVLEKNRARWSTKKGIYKIAADAWRSVHRDALRSDERRRAAEYRRFIDSTKMGKTCLDCGETYPVFCMEYDHVRGTKRICHRIRTQARTIEEAA